MFSKGSKSPEAPVPPENLPESRPTGKSSGVPSIVSADLKIVGDLTSSGDLQIDGAVEGDITSRSLTVGESAVVRGVLVAEKERIYGSVFGQVKANSVMLAKTAKVEGDIEHQTLSMEEGAALAGSLSRLEKAVGSGARPGTKPISAKDAAPAETVGQKSNGSDSASASGGAKP
jgi:cytoskeletal protein CcmA (bactofilin family)